MDMKDIYLIGRYHKNAKFPFSFFFFVFRALRALFLIKLDVFTRVSDPPFFYLKREANYLLPTATTKMLVPWLSSSLTVTLDSTHRDW